MKDGSIRLGDMVFHINIRMWAKLQNKVCCIHKLGRHITPGFTFNFSPEVWKDLPYDNKSDIWSLGCVLYEITTLKPPFRADDMEGLYKKVIRGFYPKIPAQYSQDLNNTIRFLLQVNPKMRPNCGTHIVFRINLKFSKHCKKNGRITFFASGWTGAWHVANH